MVTSNEKQNKTKNNSDCQSHNDNTTFLCISLNICFNVTTGKPLKHFSLTDECKVDTYYLSNALLDKFLHGMRLE